MNRKFLSSTFIISFFEGGDKEEISMNEFVRIYKKNIAGKLSFETNEQIYRAVASMIAEFGTIEDLKALDNYYKEEMNNENNQFTQSKVG